MIKLNIPLCINKTQNYNTSPENSMKIPFRRSETAGRGSKLGFLVLEFNRYLSFGYIEVTLLQYLVNSGAKSRYEPGHTLCSMSTSPRLITLNPIPDNYSLPPLALARLFLVSTLTYSLSSNPPAPVAPPCPPAAPKGTNPNPRLARREFAPGDDGSA